MKERSIILFLCIFGFAIGAKSQPYLAGKQVQAGLVLYPDYKDAGTYYYAPNDLRMGFESNGEPKFRLIQMRYTGTAATGDQGESRYLNMVQLTVIMPPVSNQQLQKAKEALGQNQVKLRPLPLRNVEGYFVTALGSEYRRLGEGGSFQSAGQSGDHSRGGYWTERTFTLRLNNADAQILWDQVEKGKLALSVNYAFSADVVTGEAGAMEWSGDADLLKELNAGFEDLLIPDTIPVTQLIKANSFSIEIDIQNFPMVLKKIDANVEQTVAYPFLEVQCYDFTNDLRPDLGAKAFEIEAIGVNGQPVRIKRERFFSNRPDQHTLQISFPFAIRLDRPLRYRIIETSREGTEVMTEWITRESWVGTIDITTNRENNPVQQTLLEVEAETNAFAANGIGRLNLQLAYQYRGKLQTEKLQFTPDDRVPVQAYKLLHDTDTKIVAVPFWVMDDGRKITGKRRLFSLDNYLYLPVTDLK